VGVDHRVLIAAHAAGADRMEDRRADARGGFVQLLFGLQRVAGQVFHRFERLKAGAATMRRVRRMASAATRKSCGWLR
jgi:hypothetical protein